MTLPSVLAPLASAMLLAPALALPLALTNGEPVVEENAPVTFAEHVAPIVFDNCTSCHRAGEAAPFELVDYDTVRKRGRMIQLVTQTRYMPPWKPEPGFGEFDGSRFLDADAVETLRRWVEAGMPEGDPSKTPELPEFPEGWQLGEPDLVLTMDAAFEVPADGPDIYRNFVLPTGIDEDKWVTAVEVRPSARSVVHHALYFLDDTGVARRLDAAEPEPGFDGLVFAATGNLGGWAVGGEAKHLPLGLARPLKAEDDLVLQIHFHPTGKVEKEQATVGLYFADEPPPRTFMEFQVPPEYGQYAGIDIPAGESHYSVKDTFTVPVDVELVDIAGHAHYICTKMIGRATFPDGNTEPLIFIDDWDFSWQGWYSFEEPVYLPAGTVVDVELIYDNSAANPRNPFSPPQRIGWGLESTDEMGSLIIGAVPVNEDDVGFFHLVSAGREYVRFEGDNGPRNLLERLKLMDRNGDGDVARDEVVQQARELVSYLDLDRDGTWAAWEIEALEARLQ